MVVLKRLLRQTGRVVYSLYEEAYPEESGQQSRRATIYLQVQDIEKRC